MRKFFYALFLLAFIPRPCFAQDDFSPEMWLRIEKGISEKGFLATIRTRLSALERDAIDNNDEMSRIRCLYNIMLIDDKTLEDSFYFRNTLKLDYAARQGSTLTKSVVHLLMAKRIDFFRWYYFEKKNKNLFRHPVVHYAAMTQAELQDLVQYHFDQAITFGKQSFTVAVKDMMWLCSDPLLFLFKPRLVDIIFAEKIQLLQKDVSSRNPVRNENWLQFSQDEFIVATADPAFTFAEIKVLTAYQEWINYHKPANPQEYYYIESLARKFFYNNLRSDTAAAEAYEQYLTTLSASRYETVRAHAVYQLCLLWNSKGGLYNPVQRQNNSYDAKRFQSGFREQYRYHYNKALELFNTNERLLDSFYFMKKVLLEMRQKILQPQVMLKIEDTQIPSKSILSFLHFRNAVQINAKIIRLHANEILHNTRGRNILRYFERPAAATISETLPPTGDHQWHNSFLSIDPLLPGRYILFYSDTAFSKDSSRINFTEISVTNIAVINTDEKVFVLHRQTGFPLAGAKVNVDKAAAYNTYTVSQHSKTVGPDGYVNILEKDVEGITVFTTGDTIEHEINDPAITEPKQLFDKEDYEDLAEFHEDHIRIHFFTDRAIYRPGQTVHYKAIFITKNPKTGKAIVLNKENLRSGMLKTNPYKEMLEVITEDNIITITDPFDKTIDTVRAIINKFGSIAGSFVIPKDAATGEWSFDSDYLEIDYQQRGEFLVEEYKRPTYELLLDKPTKELKLGDTFEVKARLKSFAGAPLRNVDIDFTVWATGEVPGETTIKTRTWRHDIIFEGEGKTNDKGEFLIIINDTALTHFGFTQNDKWTMSYEVEVEAIDGTGESTENKITCTLSNRPVQLNVKLPSYLDRNAITPLYITAHSPYAGALQKKVTVKIYQHEGVEKFKKNPWYPADIWLKPKADLQAMFQATYFDEGQDGFENDEAVDTDPIFETTLMAGADEHLQLPKEKLPPGSYRLEIISMEHGLLTGSTTKLFSVFDKRAGTLPLQTNSFHYAPYNVVSPGQDLTWFTGNSVREVFSIYQVQYYEKKKGRLVPVNKYIMKTDKAGLNEWRYTVPATAVGEMELTHLYIFGNTLYKAERAVSIQPAESALPEIIIEKYRQKLSPGEQASFKVSVKTKNFNTAAELMTTMYDASLEKIQRHRWEQPRIDNLSRFHTQWDYSIAGMENSSLYQYMDLEGSIPLGDKRAVWWLNPTDYHYYESGTLQLDVDRTLMGKAAGLTVLEARGLNDVVVIGYGRRSQMTGSVATVVANNPGSLNAFRNMLVILDGKVFTGKLDSIDMNSITDGLVLKGEDARSYYGKDVPNGLLLLSTKGALQLKVVPDDVPMKTRKNFEETAFFFPQLHAGTDGFYSIDFTLPESVTEWKWKMMAHTSNASFAYLEKTLVSQLPLMAQPDAPRFLYEGDQLVLKTRITNLESTKAAALLQCTVEDVITGDDVTGMFVTENKKNIFVDAASNITEAITMKVPDNMINPVRIRVGVVSKQFSDGEEYVIPILPKKIFVSTSVPVSIDKEKQVAVKLPQLPDDAVPHSMALYITPKPQAAMINALPWLADYPYGCAEQTFNKIAANAIAIKLVEKDKNIQQSLLNTTDTQDTATAKKLPDELSELSMPWLQMASRKNLDKEKLKSLFDTSHARESILKHIDELQGMQQADGGISWFKGGHSNLYISNYLLGGFGRLFKEGLLTQSFYREHQSFFSQLITYLDKTFLDPTRQLDSLSYLYARTYWTDLAPLSMDVSNSIEATLAAAWKNVHRYNIGRQAILVAATFRYQQKSGAYYEQALRQLTSLQQLAVTDANGMRWKDISNEDDLHSITEEWIVRLAEAFEAGAPQYVPAIIKWLLTTKSEHNWGTTKATADIVGLLYRQPQNMFDETKSITAVVDKTKLTATDDLMSGQQYDVVSIAASYPANVIAEKSGAAATSGEIIYYYFTEFPGGQGSYPIKLTRTFLRTNKDLNRMDTLQPGATLYVGDKITVRLSIETPKQLRYVLIDDKRAACFEPVEKLSGYEWRDGLNYYRSVRDQGMQFFADQIPSGISTISYALTVAKEGHFMSGISSIQCMYKPAWRGFTSTNTFEVTKE